MRGSPWKDGKWHTVQYERGKPLYYEDTSFQTGHPAAYQRVQALNTSPSSHTTNTYPSTVELTPLTGTGVYGMAQCMAIMEHVPETCASG